mgnify:FL=1
MPAGIAGKAGKRLLKWGQDIMGDSDEVIKKATKPKAKPKPKAKAKPKAKVETKPKAKKGKRGRKRTSRGRIPAAVKEIMDELGVDRKEATKILADRKKAAVKPKPTRTRTEGVPKRWRGFLKEQQRQMRETDPNYVPPRGSSPGLRKEYVGDKATGAEKLKYFDEFGERMYNPVEEGPPLSKVKLPTGLSQAQKRRLKMTGQAKSVAKSSKYPEGIKGTGEYAPPASYIHDMMGDRFKEGVTEPQVKELMELVESGKLTLKKKGGSIKSKKTKRKSASKPRGVGQAMRGWGATMKRRT